MSILFDHFEVLVEAPKGIKKLRELILQMAVQGKLVSRDPGDEQAAVLLEKIKAEKKRLVKEGKLKAEKPLPPIAEEEKPYELPNGWEWVRLDDICSYIQRGKGPKYVEFSDIPVISQKCVQWSGFDIKKTRFIDPKSFISYGEERLLRTGDLLLNSTGVGTLGRINYYNHEDNNYDKVVVDSHVTIIRALLIYSQFICIFFKCSTIQEKLEDCSTGSTKQTELYASIVKSQIVPIPPLREQYRIVEKVDRLMALCDELEKQEAERDQKQVEMNTACLEKLFAAREPGETRVQWQRIAGHFDILYNKPGNVEKLKQAILQMAVQGKLEPQDPQDEPAAVLLEKIKAEKERLIKEGKLKAEKPLPPIAEEEKPYGLPNGWEWVRLDTICYLITDGTHHTPKYLPMGIPFLSVKDISRGILDFSNVKYISIDEHEALKKRCYPEFGDILFTKVGTTGIAKAIDIEKEFSIFVSLALLKIPKNYLNSEFMERLLNSPLVRKSSEEGTEGVGNKNLVLRKIKAFIVPIPPLNEQKRIVAKVERLMALCNELGEGLRQAETLREKLLQAVLAQTLPGKSW